MAAVIAFIFIAVIMLTFGPQGASWGVIILLGLIGLVMVLDWLTSHRRK